MHQQRRDDEAAGPAAASDEDSAAGGPPGGRERHRAGCGAIEALLRGHPPAAGQPDDTSALDLLSARDPDPRRTIARNPPRSMRGCASPRPAGPMTPAGTGPGRARSFDHRAACTTAPRRAVDTGAVRSDRRAGQTRRDSGKDRGRDARITGQASPDTVTGRGPRILGYPWSAITPDRSPARACGETSPRVSPCAVSTGLRTRSRTVLNHRRCAVEPPRCLVFDLALTTTGVQDRRLARPPIRHRFLPSRAGARALRNHMTTTPPNRSSSRWRPADGQLEVITPDGPPELTDELARALLRVLRPPTDGHDDPGVAPGRQSRDVAS